MLRIPHLNKNRWINAYVVVERNEHVTSTTIILGPIIVSAPKAKRKEANWNGGIREGTRHGEGWGTTTNGWHPHVRTLTREEVWHFPRERTGQCGGAVVGEGRGTK